MSTQLTTDWLSKHSQRLNHEFNLNGYVSLPGFFNADEVAEIRENTMSFPCKAGHLIAHHSLTTHWADGNTSKNKSRQAMGAIYYGEHCKENIASKKAYQAALNAQLAAKGMILSSCQSTTSTT